MPALPAVLAVLAGLLLVPTTPPDDVTARDGEPTLQRVSTAAPWPRGITWADGQLLVLARGVHRSAGGPHPEIVDHGGHVYRVDPEIHEPVVEGGYAGDAVRDNGRILAAPTDPPFHIWTRELPTTSDTHTDRPYAGLVYDERSRNLFVLCFAGIDLPEAPYFRKNATDGVLRYDLRTETWHVVDRHDPASVPEDLLGQTLPNEAYPHHDPSTNPPPHGLPNGPCGAAVVGDFLYVAAKDNSALIQYDLGEIRADPEAGPPDGRYVFHRADPRDDVFLRTRAQGDVYVEGTCAVAADEQWLYVAFRTTSQVMRFPIDERGELIRPLVGDVLAEFDAYDPEGGAYGYGGPANIFDLRVNGRGELFVSTSSLGSVWRVPLDGESVLDGRRGSGAAPYVNLRELSNDPKATAGNFCFDPQDNMYICTRNKDVEDGKQMGTVYRVPPY